MTELDSIVCQLQSCVFFSFCSFCPSTPLLFFIIFITLHGVPILHSSWSHPRAFQFLSLLPSSSQTPRPLVVPWLAFPPVLVSLTSLVPCPPGLPVSLTGHTTCLCSSIFSNSSRPSDLSTVSLGPLSQYLLFPRVLSLDTS